MLLAHELDRLGAGSTWKDYRVLEATWTGRWKAGKHLPIGEIDSQLEATDVTRGLGKAAQRVAYCVERVSA